MTETILLLLPVVVLSVTTTYALLAVSGGLRFRWVPRWLFPEPASRRVRRYVGACALALIIAVFILDVFFVGIKRTIVCEMNWSYGNKKDERGRQEIVMTFTKLPNYFYTFYSEDLANSLESLQSRSVPVTFDLIYDFGSLRDYRFRLIGNWPAYRRNTGAGPSGSYGGDYSTAELFEKLQE